MRVWTALTLFLLCAAKVHCDYKNYMCPRKESPPGVLTLTQGSEVILGCRGDVTVDAVPLAVTTKTKEKSQKEAVTEPLRSSNGRKNLGTTGSYPTEIKTVAVHVTMNPNGIDVQNKRVNVNTANPPTITPNGNIRTGHVLLGNTQTIQHNRSSRVSRHEKAFSTTTNRGITSETSTSTKYEDYDYEDTEEGLRVTRSIRRRARWTKNDQLVREGMEKGGVLRLPALRMVDSGNYSCYRGDRLVSSVKISVGVSPERPTLSCHKKSHTSKIRCEWISRQPIIPRPQCYLLLRKGFEKFSRVNCSYSPGHSRCWCALPCVEGDRNYYDAKLCVTNTVGNATSPSFTYIPPDIIKPDPPAQVLVKPVEGEPHTLCVTWTYPSTWKQNHFYILHFQLRYRPVQALEYQLVYISTDSLKHLWLISDALPNTQYEIQLHAKDEFDGMWSDWSSPVYGHTWTAPKPTMAIDVYTSLEPFWNLYEDGSGELEVNPGGVIRPEAGGFGIIYMLWVVGLCLLITIIMLSVYSIRIGWEFSNCSYLSSVFSSFRL
ncbi:interleukin-6 receptor subunit alpha isoform X2 [Trichomycterus rosablanca]|uniref:interleukin-6 receptor subunit alpha isoform X2 n=1 Tax=Trichomycterus rosablanca TaxID=2290929 RepID=UPI002F357386